MYLKFIHIFRRLSNHLHTNVPSYIELKFWITTENIWGKTLFSNNTTFAKKFCVKKIFYKFIIVS